MASIQEIFKTALGIVVKDNWGAQTQISKVTGFTPQKINKFLTGELKNGLEDDRRAIAAATGYSYEDFLDIGRKALGLPLFNNYDKSETIEYINLAKQILASEEAETFKNLIDSISTKIIYKELISEVGKPKAINLKIRKQALLDNLMAAGKK